MDTEREKAIILDYLETYYCGAMAVHDEELTLRLARAIVAFKADIYKDIFIEDALDYTSM